MTLSHMLKRLVIVEVHYNQQELFLMVVRNIRLVLDMCELLLSSMIVGALEFNWGSMQVEYIHPSNPEVVETIYVYTDDYIDCFEQVFTE